ncbi:hypothetical protein GCM10009773_24330 [Williamsia serinedens]
MAAPTRWVAGDDARPSTRALIAVVATTTAVAADIDGLAPPAAWAATLIDDAVAATARHRTPRATGLPDGRGAAVGVVVTGSI